MSVDCTTKRIGECSSGTFQDFKNAQTRLTMKGTPFNWTTEVEVPMATATLKLFDGLDMPEKIDAKDAWIRPNENVSDVMIVTFNDKSKNGLIVIDGKGIWSVTVNDGIPWRAWQSCDLVPLFGPDGSIQFDSLK